MPYNLISPKETTGETILHKHNHMETSLENPDIEKTLYFVSLNFIFVLWLMLSMMKYPSGNLCKDTNYKTYHVREQMKESTDFPSSKSCHAIPMEQIIIDLDHHFSELLKWLLGVILCTRSGPEINHFTGPITSVYFK